MLTNLALAAAAVFAGPSASPTPLFVGSPWVPPPAVSTGAVSMEAVSMEAVSMGAEPMGAVPASDPVSDAANVVSFETDDKLLLEGSYFAPKKKRGSTDPAPAALLLHDASHSRSDLDELAEYLHKKGFAVLTVDLRGHGGSKTDEMSFEKADEKAQETLWALCSRDVDAAASFLLDQEGVHATNLSIFGVGASSALAVRRATDDKNVRSVVLINPTASAYGYNVVKGVGDLGGLPTLLVSAKDNKDIAKRIQGSAHDANDGLEFVDVIDLKSDTEKTFDDKKLKAGAANWLRDQVMPRK